MDDYFTPDDSPEHSPERESVLDGTDLGAVARYMTSDKCRNVFLMIGAGVSTSAGIPDFRSPDTGLYANLAKLELPYAEAVFEINYFRTNPEPFYTLARELYPGRFRPTIAHSFVRLLADKSLLHTCFTQNIDTLERAAGVPEPKLVEAHGSFATQRCVDCKQPYDGKKMKAKVQAQEIPRCEHCDGLVKPDIVFFGEPLPTTFSHSIPSLMKADLLIIMGTSLTVHPFAALAHFVPERCPRVLFNLQRVGNLGSNRNDVVCLGECDTLVKELCEELGWTEELNELWEATASTVEAGAQPAMREAKLKDEVDKITEAIGKKLVLEEVTKSIAEKQAETAAQDVADASASSEPAEAELAAGGKQEDGKPKEADAKAAAGSEKPDDLSEKTKSAAL